MENSERIQNYYDAVRKLYANLFSSFESSLSGLGITGGMQKLEAKQVADKFSKVLDNLESITLKQQQRIDNMSPEEYQQETLNSLDQFENYFNQAYQQVQEGLSKEREYINSPQFLNDSQNQAQQSQQLMNGMLDGFTTILNSLTNNMAKSS